MTSKLRDRSKLKRTIENIEKYYDFIETGLVEENIESENLKRRKLNDDADTDCHSLTTEHQNIKSGNKYSQINQSKLNHKRIIVWLRNDLRLSDNYALTYAIQQATSKISQIKGSGETAEILPVFCFDPRLYDNSQSKTKFESRKTGAIRSQFQLETIECLRNDLQAIGSNLIVSCEKPEKYLCKLLSEDSHNIIVYQQEICYEELQVEHNIVKQVQNLASQDPKMSIQIESVWGSTLHHIDDLPYDPQEYLPHVYGKFREKNSAVKVRHLLENPTSGQMPFCAKMSKDIEKGIAFMPTLEQFGFSNNEIKNLVDKRRCYPFEGGEEHGMNRVQEYINQNKSISHYNDTRNHLIGSEYSSKLSPWLSNGSISIRSVYFAVRDFQKKNGTNESIKVFIDEIFWRDFARYWCMRHGNKIFTSYGIYNRSYYNWHTNMDTVNKWKEGRTGMPLIDSLMRELNATGFMPNRGRMIVACYLTMDLKQDWRYGAHHFEEKLIDHDVHSNTAGWNLSSGIGPGRVLVFNSQKQSRDFDKNGKYIKKWCPELKPVGVDYIHDPWNMPKTKQNSLGFKMGQDYPNVIKCSKYTSPEAAKKYKREIVEV